MSIYRAPAAWTTTPKSVVVCIGTSEAEETKNRRLRSRYCTVEANY